MKPLSVGSGEFSREVETRLGSYGPFLMVVRRSNSAGARDYYLVDSLQAFQNIVSSLPARTSVLIVSRVKPLVAGTINEELMEGLALVIPDDVNLLVVYQNPRSDWRQANEYSSWLYSGIDVAGITELRQELRENVGETVDVLLYPDLINDSGTLLEGIVPDADGEIVKGIY